MKQRRKTNKPCANPQRRCDVQATSESQATKRS